MPRVYRQQYTRPIPEDAQRVEDAKGRPAVRFKGPDGKNVVAPLTEKGDACRTCSPYWYGRVKGEPVRLSTNKAAAEIMLGELCRKAEMGQAGAVDPFEAHGKRPLAAHVDDFAKVLEGKGDTPEHVALTVSRVKALLASAGAAFPADLDAARVSEALGALRRPGKAVELPEGQASFAPGEVAALFGISGAAVRASVKRHTLAATGQGKARRLPLATVEALAERMGRGRGLETVNHYVRAVRSFARWMVRAKRMASNPLDGLSLLNSQVEVRHARRELTAAELGKVLALSRASSRTFRGLDGSARFHLYAAACGTGFRAGALASLTPESFDLAGDGPTVTLAARKNKSRKPKVQPLPGDVADLLRAYLAGKPAGERVWGGTWAKDHRGAEMLRIDLEAAGIPYTVEGPDGPLHADFHALRHTYLTLGGRAGIDLRTLQELAGHSTPTLTARYSHRRLYDLQGAVEKMPNFLPAPTGPGADQAEGEALRATGTEGAPGQIPPGEVRLPYTPLTQFPDTGRGEVRLGETSGPDTPAAPSGRNPLLGKGVDTGRGRVRLLDASEDDGTRTRNHRIDSPVL